MKSGKGRPLELDIFNEKLRIAVEHHGIQHYRALVHWNGIEGLEKQRANDQLRREFCAGHGILLVEIRELGTRTSLEEMRRQVREALVLAGRIVPPSFDRAGPGNPVKDRV